MNIVKRVHGVTKSYNMHNRFVDDFSRDIEAELDSVKSHISHKKPYDEKPKKQHSKALIAKDIMTKELKTLPMNATLREAIELIQRYGFRHIPILDQNETLVGMLSDRDILARSDNSHLDKPVSNYMSNELFASRTTTSIKELAGVMIFEKIHALPVTSAEEKVLGIVTSSDILRALWRNGPVETWA